MPKLFHFSHFGRRLVLLLGALVLCGVPVWAIGGKRIRFDRLTIDEGLPQSTISTMLQDRFGFLWFGTQGGLSKYDGYHFTTYRYDPMDPTSLSSNQVTHLFEQSNGVLWVVVNNTLMHRFNRETETFTRFFNDPNDPSSFGTPGNPQITRLVEDRDGRLWVGTGGGGLFRFNEAKQSWVHYRNDKDDPLSLSHNGVSELVPARDGTLWVGTVSGLNGLDPKTGKFTRYMHDPNDPNTLGSDLISGNINNPVSLTNLSMWIDDQQTVWVCGRGVLSHLDPQTGMFERFPLPPAASQQVLNGILEDGLGYLWVSVGQDLYRLDRGKGQFELFQHDPKDPNSLSLGVVIVMHEDREGNLWFSTALGGLNLYDRRKNRFIKFRTRASDPYSIGTNTVSSIFQDNSGSLWFGSFDNGLSKYCPEKQKFPHYLHPYVEPAPLQENVVWGMWEAEDGAVWVGTRSEGLVVFDLAENRILKQYQNDPNDPKSIPAGVVWTVNADAAGTIHVATVLQQPPFTGLVTRLNAATGAFEQVAPWATQAMVWDQDGKLLVGRSGSGGLGIYDPATGETQDLLTDLTNPARSLGPVVWRLMLEGDVLWAGTGTGLRKYHRDTDKLELFQHNDGDPTSISHNSVMSIIRDHRGRLWAGTFGGGLNLMDEDTATFRHFNTRQGLPDDVIYSILSDDQNMLWMSTNHGLCRFDPETFEVRNYDRSDGLQSNEFDAVSYHKSPSGRLYFGGVNGFNAFYPSELRDNPAVPLVVVSATKNFDENIGSELANDDTIMLDHTDNLVEFRFAALDFTHSERNQYAYKLEGFDGDWIQAGTRRTATYTNLDSGWYRLRVKGSNSDGVWNQTGSTIHLYVQPPFWETWWFYSLCVLAGLGLLGLGFMAQLGRVHRQKEDELRARDLKRKSEELEYARKIQLGMLPERNISRERLEVVGQMITATEVGGDYFDFFEMGEDRLCIAYGDATGHGMAAGLIVGMVKMAGTVWSLNPGTTLTDMINDLNTGLRKSIPAQGMGMAFGLAMLDLKHNRAELCAGGMPFPLHWNAEAGELRPIELKGPPLGFLRKISVPRKTVALHEGDYLIFLSDGFNERFNPENQIWGDAALTAALEKICRTTVGAHDVVHALTEACHRFAAGRKNDDDMTIVVVRIRRKHVGQSDKVDCPLSLGATGPLG